jgi:hypothetical protein
MGLFGTTSKGVILVDIGSASVAGAWMYQKKGEAPVMCYSTRIDIEVREGESVTDSMLRTLQAVCIQLVREGAPAYSREVGHGRIEMVLASVAAPWQETSIHTVTLAEEQPFVFTRALLQKVVAAKPPSPDRIVSDTSVISTVLNGYETEQPWGKRAHKAELTVLTSTLEKSVAKSINTELRKAFHSHHIELVAFAPVAYAVLSNLYPLQKEYVLLDVSGSATDALIVKKGVLAGVTTHPQGVHDLLKAGREAGRGGIVGAGAIDTNRNAAFAPKVAAAESAWLEGVKQMLATFAGEHPLPHTVFLLADEGVRPFLKRLIDDSSMRTLWLSEEPLSVIALTPEHTASIVRARGLADGDIFLSMLALFYQDRLQKG